MSEALYEVYPQNVGFKNGLAISYIRMGLIHEEMKKSTEANSYYQSAKRLWAELVNQFPQYADFNKNLAWVKRKLGEE